ncbi:MAG: class I SAM-dependent RNA methyltransferase, partial [Polyangiales bacterium]
MRGNAAKRERATLTIERLVAGGAGLARRDGEVVLVPHVAVGEEVAVELDRSRRPARGALLKVLKPSAERVVPPCPVFEACGGCDLLHLTRTEQRRVRLDVLRSALPASLASNDIRWIDASPDRGRTRARWHAKSVGGRVIVGQRAHGAHAIVDLAGCYALDPRLEAALGELRAILRECVGDGEIQGALGSNGLPAMTIHWRGTIAASAFGSAEQRVRDGAIAGVELWSEGASKPATIGDPRVVVRLGDGSTLVSPPGAFAQASEIGDA